MDYIDLGRRVKELRRKQSLTQEALAEKLDISTSFLGHIERGTRIASLETLVKLCIALDTDPNYLLAASTGSLLRRVPESMSEETQSSWPSYSIRDIRYCNRNKKNSSGALRFQSCSLYHSLYTSLRCPTVSMIMTSLPSWISASRR